MVAAKANQPEVMRALVAGGADPKLKAQDGSTLLMAAVGSGHVEAVQYALRTGFGRQGGQRHELPR